MSSSSSSTNPAPTVVRWVLDTRNLWPEAKETKQLAQFASEALDLLPDSERQQVLRYVFVRDAKLTLGSVLLKRYAISRFCGVPWSEATAVRDARTKPVFIMPAGSTPDGASREPLIFNVTHQAGLVALFAVHHPPPGLAIGVDIVCQGERSKRDHATIAGQGWPHFVDVHDEVFSPREVARLKRLPFGTSERLLAYFYALWCLREAYVKMTGEALLAPWLHDLEMRSFAPPGEQAPTELKGYDAEDKDYPRDLEVWFHKAKVEDVDMTLTKLLDEYMISTSVRRGTDGSGLEEGEFQVIDIAEVLAAAQSTI
ncbi:4'-phosphopantetheinyl transferase NpgA [Paramyrothecium foliicola]|nr:4'-phosphopantetheinyl transferase NpgA [Paramyrothecium foliicola]